MKQVGAAFPRPRTEDPFYQKMMASNRDVLTRRFDDIRAKLSDRLHQLMTRNRTQCVPGRATYLWPEPRPSATSERAWKKTEATTGRGSQ